MSWYQKKWGRFAYAPGNNDSVSDSDGVWWKLVGPFYYLCLVRK